MLNYNVTISSSCPEQTFIQEVLVEFLIFLLSPQASNKPDLPVSPRMIQEAIGLPSQTECEMGPPIKYRDIHMSANTNVSKDNMKATRKQIAWVTSHPTFYN